MLATLAFLTGCEIPVNSTEKNDLASMRTVTIEIAGRTTYTAYVADSEDDGGRKVLLGLTFVLPLL